MRDSLTLSGDEYDILEIPTARLALDLIAAERPDVVLLDINMPEVSGIPVCTEIKRNPATAGVQIIVVSAGSGSDFIADCLSAGADDYVIKPFQPEELARRVRKALSATVVA